MLLQAANTSRLTRAVMFRCVHFDDRFGAVMILGKAIEHWQSCRPQIVAASVEDFELAERRN